MSDPRLIGLAKAWSFGALPMLVLAAWVITAGRWSFLQTRGNIDVVFDGVFDAQARALLAGHLDVPAEIPRWEGILIDGKTYVYHGIFPALLRLPVLVVTDRLDGQLTTLSMLLATVVIAVASFRLSSALRRAIRGRVPMARGEKLATAALAVALLSGPSLLLESEAIIYHEAIIWGLAWSLASFDAVLRWQQTPTARHLAIAAALITLAMLSRQSVAVGPLATLALVGALRLWKQRRELPDRAKVLGRPAATIAVALLIPVLVSSAFHYPRTGSLVGTDIRRFAELRELRGLTPELYDEHFVMGPRHLGRSVSWYLRPIGIELRRDFPWVDFPIAEMERANRGWPIVIADPTPSLHWVSPALSALCAVGVVWLIRTRRERSLDQSLWPLLAGAAAGAATVFLYWGVSVRYLPDIFPVLVIGGLIGYHALFKIGAGRSRRTRSLALAGFGSLVLFGAVVSLLLSLEFQRERWWDVPTEWRAEMVRWRLQLPGAREPVVIDADDPVPPPRDGQLLVVGTCDQRFIGSEQGRWVPLSEGGPAEDDSSDTGLTQAEARQCFL